MPNDIDQARNHLSNLFSRNAEAFRLVSGIAIGVPPASETVADNLPTASETVADNLPTVITVFVRNAPHCELQEVWNRIWGDLQAFAPLAPFSLLIASDFVALQAATGGSIGLDSPSRGNLPEVNAGTLGAVVQLGQRFFLLGSNHAMAFNGRALGAPVFTPGTVDNANGGMVIGSVKYFVPLQPGATPPNRADCALAETSAFALAQLQPVTVVPPVTARTRVSKTGRTSGNTRSQVCFWNFDTLIDFSFGTYYCSQLMGTAGPSPGPPWPAFAERGDSGSLVETGGNGLGLIMARAYCSNIFQPILPAAGAPAWSTLPAATFRGYILALCSLSAVREELAAVITATGSVTRADQLNVFRTR